MNGNELRSRRPSPAWPATSATVDEGLATRRIIDELLPERLERLRKVTGLPIALGGTTRHGSAGLHLVLDRLTGNSGDALRGLVVQPGKGLGGCVLRSRSPFRVNDYASTMAITHEYDPAVRQEGLTSVFAVPVLVRGEVRGVLYGAVRAGNPIGDRTVRSALVVAEQLQSDVEGRLRRDPGHVATRSRGALAELAALIRDTTDPQLRTRLERIQADLTGETSRAEPTASLAPREIDVLRLAEVGASNLEIAARLGLSLETVKAYLRSAMRKLEVHNRTAAAHQARLNGLL
ncbi:LuxR C-terminal-related transcriptional regulator [Amycolatopsis rhabdoformis]|uniref:LuxR C-terminal-related transcriptional regulator n=1 Tax=Amycolatopsis rhabdoformis TaxID=1448059 RepID=A0ABZ1HV73_9PSEU|nr:LuxR C-terminal-related transcriptional regulator [Amycolatopsis rhabdoformis]WSE26219.1 LuxR C-terminal-related transcriptional regulator [Amycolatopsis rhabdoformis]